MNVEMSATRYTDYMSWCIPVQREGFTSNYTDLSVGAVLDVSMLGLLELRDPDDDIACCSWLAMGLGSSGDKNMFQDFPKEGLRGKDVSRPKHLNKNGKETICNVESLTTSDDSKLLPWVYEENREKGQNLVA